MTNFNFHKIFPSNLLIEVPFNRFFLLPTKRKEKYKYKKFSL